MLVLRRAAVALALLVAVATGAVGAVVTVAPAAHAVTAGDYADQAHRTTNYQRAQRDLARLGKNRCLREFAVRQAARMARRRTMFHQDLAPILRECGLAVVGENVAYGYPTGRAVVNRGWMRSPLHRANILDARYRVMAIAARRGSDGHWYVAQVFGRRLL